MAQDSKYGNVSIPGIPDDEPVFIIRGKDAAAPEAVFSYGQCARAEGASLGFALSCGIRADEILAWQSHPDNLDKVKVPD